MKLYRRMTAILSVVITIVLIQVFGGYTRVIQVLGGYTRAIRSHGNSSKPYLRITDKSILTENNTHNEPYLRVTDECIPTENNTHTICPTVHIAMVLYNHTENWSVYLAIKSILMYRSTKLHFHFVTDNRTKTVLHAILSSWQVPGITHDYYDLAQASESIRKTFTDSPTANCFGTLSIKLNLHSVLPDSVQHVLVIEPTSIVNADLFEELWSVTVSCANHVITLCSEKCVSYCHRGTTVLRDNTREDVLLHGAMGLNLDRIRSSSLAKYWTEILDSVYLCRPNAIETVYNVIRMYEETAAFNNPDNNQNQNLANVCKLVQEYNGNFLRYKEVKQCTKMRPIAKPLPNAKRVCEVFAWERAVRRRELPFLLGHSYSSSDEYDVTMSTHLDYNRMSMIERTLTNWDGPVSIAIQVTDSQASEVIDFILNSTILRQKKNISYHLLFKIGPSYPPNYMRSLAHKHVSTPYVFFNDIDYVTSYQLYSTMKQHLKQLGNINKTAIVIPAFETDEVGFNVPHNKSGMLKCISRNQVRQFHKKIWNEGHEPTNYAKWKTATKPYYIKFKDMYEPYCLLKTSVFSFDHRFVGRFRNKASHTIELNMAGYKFLVLHDCFIIHLPHPVNEQNMAKLRTCSTQWYRDWVIEKRKKYDKEKRKQYDKEMSQKQEELEDIIAAFFAA